VARKQCISNKLIKVILKIRNATPADALAIAEIHVKSWQHTYRGVVPDVYLDSMTVTTREAVWRETLAQSRPKVIVAESEGKIVGFCSFGRCRDDNAAANDGEIWALYLSPLYYGMGFGHALLTEARAQLLAQGKVKISLWVIVGNERAGRFYNAQGFEVEQNSLKTFALAGADIEEMRYVQKF
jgi:ribosomal protein S18 acetylase RimI-like enzyme